METARKFVMAALSQGAHARPEGRRLDGAVDIIGGNVSLRCRVEPDPARHLARLVVVSAYSALTPDAIERICAQAYAVKARWHVCATRDPIPVGVTSADDLLSDLDDYERTRRVERIREERREDLVGAWRKVLEVDERMRNEDAPRVPYDRWDLEHGGAMLRVWPRVGSIVPAFECGRYVTMSGIRGRPVSVGTFVETDGTSVLVSRLPDVSVTRITGTGYLSADDRQTRAAIYRQRKALHQVLDSRCANPRLPDLLVDPGQAGTARVSEVESYFTPDLDESKRDAVRRGLGAQDLYLVVGPPGTGKTAFISELVAQILSRQPDARLLVVAQSNVAVDHLLAKVVQLRPDLRAVRIGHPDRVSGESQSYLLETRVGSWASQVRDRCEAGLAARWAVQANGTGAEPYLDLVGELERLLPTVSSDRETETGPCEDLQQGLGLLETEFPMEVVEPSRDCMRRLRRVSLRKFGVPYDPVGQTLDAWTQRVGKTADFYQEYLLSCSVVAGTCVGVIGAPHLPEHFDWAIIDEAGRATAPELLIPLVRARRAVVVGDDRQLPPTVDFRLREEVAGRDDIDPYWLKTSLFEYLAQKLPTESKHTLKIQYRMHPAIAGLIAQSFYSHEQLESAVRAADREHDWARWRTPIVWLSTSACPDRFEREAGQSASNLCEAKIVGGELDLLEADLRERGLRKTAAVIAAYMGQVDLLRRLLDPEDKSKWQALDLEVGTVDAFQGRDRDVVLYSIVRSNPEGRIGFLGDFRRVNVAMSRARELLMVVGDLNMVAQAKTREINPFDAVLSYLRGHPEECTIEER